MAFLGIILICLDMQLLSNVVKNHAGETMKQIIQQREAYSLHMEITPVGTDHYVKFETLFAEAKMPDHLTTKLEMFLTDVEFHTFKCFINKYIINHE